jgi:hypothetical protein
MAIPGIPALPRNVNVFSATTLLDADQVSLFGGATPQWGIFLDGAPVVVADNVMALDFRKFYRNSKYPQEQGAFATYNKVALPFEPRVSFSTGGSVADRQALLDSVDTISGNLNLYDVVTPEVTYHSCNVVGYDYRRYAANAGLLTVEVWLEQVVIAGRSTFSNTTSPSDAAQKNGGLVQPGPIVGISIRPTPAEIK